MYSLDKLQSFINLVARGMHTLSLLLNEAAENGHKIINELVQKLGPSQKVLQLIHSHNGNRADLILESRVSFVRCDLVDEKCFEFSGELVEIFICAICRARVKF